MRIMKRSGWVAALAALAVLATVGDSGCARAEEPLPVLRVAVESNWPPMEFRDQDGRLAGYSVDLIRAVAHAAGFRVEFREVAWDHIFDGLLDGEYDIISSSVSITPDRLRDMDFSQPYFTVRQALLGPRGATAATDADLRDWRIGAQIGTTGHFAADQIPDVDLVVYNDIAAALAALAAATLDGVICDDPVAAAEAMRSQGGARPLEVLRHFESGEPEVFGFAVKKGRADLLALLNAGLTAVREAGVVDELREKWLGD